jgi:MYXO-CTERM domain-containing protein
MRSVKSIAILVSLFSAAAAQAEPLFFESFEDGNGRWQATDGNAIAIASGDDGVCSSSYQHETIPHSGARVMTDSAIAVTGGADYCVSAWVRASSDSMPFLGLQPLDADGNAAADVWLIGDTSLGAEVQTTSDDVWHWYAAPVTLDVTTTKVNLQDMMFTGSGYADFDDIAIAAGPCPTAYAGVDQHATCSSDAPVCGSDGACSPVVTPPGDMGGGPSSTPDMGGAVSSNFPGGNTTLTPATPVAAEGTPLGTGAVTSEAGEYGCSMGGREGQRSFGLMMLAFVVVMLAGRRRRRV